MHRLAGKNGGHPKESESRFASTNRERSWQLPVFRRQTPGSRRFVAGFDKLQPLCFEQPPTSSSVRNLAAEPSTFRGQTKLSLAASLFERARLLSVDGSTPRKLLCSIRAFIVRR